MWEEDAEVQQSKMWLKAKIKLEDSQGT